MIIYIDFNLDKSLLLRIYFHSFLYFLISITPSFDDVIIYDKNLKQAIYKVRARQIIKDIFKRLKYDTKTLKKFK